MAMAGSTPDELDGWDAGEPDFASAADRARYFIPSPEEIAAGCREIQEEWSDAERAKRWLGKPRIAVDPGRVHRSGSND